MVRIQKFRDPSQFRLLARAISLCLMALGAELSNGRNFAAEVAGGYRCLFVIDTSLSMARPGEHIPALVVRTVVNGLDGQLQPGDRIGIWTFRETVSTGDFPPLIWDPARVRELAGQAYRYANGLRYAGQAKMDQVLLRVFDEISRSEALTVIIISDGNEQIVGSPFDQSINLIYAENRRALRRTGVPFITVLAAYQGKIHAWGVHNGEGRFPIPALPSNSGDGTTNQPPTALTQSTPAEESEDRTVILARGDEPEPPEPAVDSGEDGSSDAPLPVEQKQTGVEETDLGGDGSLEGDDLGIILDFREESMATAEIPDDAAAQLDQTASLDAIPPARLPDDPLGGGAPSEAVQSAPEAESPRTLGASTTDQAVPTRTVTVTPQPSIPAPRSPTAGTDRVPEPESPTEEPAAEQVAESKAPALPTILAQDTKLPPASTEPAPGPRIPPWVFLLAGVVLAAVTGVLWLTWRSGHQQPSVISRSYNYRPKS